MTRRTVTSSTALTSLLERASRLLDQRSHPPCSAARPQPPADPTGVLVEAGWFMLQQLTIVLGFTVSDADADRLVPDGLERATAFGIASAPSVGAAAAILDQVRTDDPVALARTILATRAALGDVEIIDGVCALVAALTVQIAECVALDPHVVHGELAERAAANVKVCRSTVGRVRSARRVLAPRPCAGRVARRLEGVTVAAIPLVNQHH